MKILQKIKFKKFDIMLKTSFEEYVSKKYKNNQQELYKDLLEYSKFSERNPEEFSMRFLNIKCLYNYCTLEYKLDFLNNSSAFYFQHDFYHLVLKHLSSLDERVCFVKKLKELNINNYGFLYMNEELLDILCSEKMSKEIEKDPMEYFDFVCSFKNKTYFSDREINDYLYFFSLIYKLYSDKINHNTVWTIFTSSFSKDCDNLENKDEYYKFLSLFFEKSPIENRTHYLNCLNNELAIYFEKKFIVSSIIDEVVVETNKKPKRL